MNVVTKEIGWTYTVDPYTGWPTILLPPTNAAVAASMFRYDAPAVRLPVGPYSYPSLGREPPVPQAV
jgi:hypothetical protein